MAIHSDDRDWPSPIQDLCMYLQQHQGSQGRNILLEFLTLFPEEATNACSGNSVRLYAHSWTLLFWFDFNVSLC